MQTGDGRAFGAVYMKRHQIAAVNARTPGRIDLGDNTAFQFKGGVGGIVGVGVIWFIIFVPTFRIVNGTQTADGAHGTERVFQHIAPMTQHVQDDAAAIRLAIIPARPLGRFALAGKHPIAEFTPHRQDTTEKPLLDQMSQFQNARKGKFVMDDAVLGAGFSRMADHIHGVF